MIVGFREYDGKPSPEWLEVGAVLVGPDGVQYEKVKVGSYSSRWKVVGDQDESVSSERMCELVGDGEYKKHFLGISDNVTYFVEQMEAAQVDTYHYKVTFQPEAILPDIDLQTSLQSGS